MEVESSPKKKKPIYISFENIDAFNNAFTNDDMVSGIEKIEYAEN